MAPSAVSPGSTSLPVVTKNQTTAEPAREVVPGSKHASLKTPLEAISHGNVVMPGIPTFPSYMEHRRHILVHMAATFRYFARCNFTEGQSGHISVRDPEHPGLMWMNPLGRHFGMLTAGDMICVDIESGTVVSTSGGKPHIRTLNAAGYLIHSAVHKRRGGDVHAICHAHSNAGRAWSVFARPLEMLNQDICFLHGHHAVYAQYGGIVFGADEGENIADALGAHNKAAILMNHGLITVGATVDEAGFLFGIMDRSCAMQLQVEAAAANGIPKNIISDEEAKHNFIMASETNALYREAQPDLEYEMECAGGEDKLARGFEDLALSA